MCESRPCSGKPVIGLAGGIGAGKSMVAALLAELGAAVVDSDAIARAILSDPGVAETLRNWWGDSVLDAQGRIDRRRVGDRVFTESSCRDRLEQLLHPLVAQERGRLIERYRADPAVRAIVIDSPLLFETGLDRACDVVWFVHAERLIRTERVTASRSWTPEELDRREKLQKPLDFKQAKADYSIVNNSGIDDLRPQVVRLLDLILERTAHTKS